MLIVVIGVMLLPVLALSAELLLGAPVQLEQIPPPVGSIGLLEIVVLSGVCALATFLLAVVMGAFVLILARQGGARR
jgi:hypothetical protein